MTKTVLFQVWPEGSEFADGSFAAFAMWTHLPVLPDLEHLHAVVLQGSRVQKEITFLKW